MYSRPNFLFITSDQQRLDTIGRVNGAIRTPNLDRLAARGILFRRGYTVNPVCTPSRVSMLTGQYPSRHGCFHVGTSLPRDYAPTLSARLAGAGYHTALLGKAHFQACLDPNAFESAPNVHNLDYFRKWSGPYYGFEHAQLVIGHTSESHACGMHYGAWLADQGVRLSDYFGIFHYTHFGVWPLPQELHGSKWVADCTIRAMDAARKAEKPFFLWSSFQDPHNPYIAPEPWASMYDPSTMPPPQPLDGATDGKPPFYESVRHGRHYGDDPDLQHRAWGDCRPQPNMSLNDIGRLRAAYYGMVSLMDHHIGRILDALEERKMLENTVIVFTSDHGDYLGDYGLWGKGLPAYDVMQKVPFLVSHPHCNTPGETSDSFQSVVDIEATFSNLAGLSPSPGSQGIDQQAAWMDASKQARDWCMMEFRPAESPFMQRTFVTGPYKLVLYHERSYGELYDLNNDPHQLRNLFDDPSSRTLRDELIRRFVWAEMEKDGRQQPRTAMA